MSSADKSVLNPCVDCLNILNEPVFFSNAKVEKPFESLREQKIDVFSRAISNCDNKKNSTISTPDIQFTSADGFFNRKRGRPPKNRYVQVYKNLQLPPQAVFTSFKLERTISIQEHESRRNLTSYGIVSSPSVLIPKHNDCASGKLVNGENMRQTTYVRIKRKEQRSVVRSSGTYFPENVSMDKSAKIALNISTSRTENNKSCLILPVKRPTCESESNESPEDLSIHLRASKGFYADSKIYTYSYLNMFYFLNMYRRSQEGQPESILGNQTQQADEDLTMVPNPHMEMQNEDINTSESTSSVNTIPVYLKKNDIKQPQSYFNCVRDNCQHGFSDKARFQKYSTRHRRLDALLGNHFKQYQSYISCEYPSCTNIKFNAKKYTSHFHCTNCSFRCWEKNKITPHRRWYGKLESLKKARFRKILNNEN